MNTIYNVVWNSTTGTWVVASEMAKGRKKKSKAASAATAAALVTTVGLGAGAAVMPSTAMAGTSGLCMTSIVQGARASRGYETYTSPSGPGPNSCLDTYGWNSSSYQYNISGDPTTAPGQLKSSVFLRADTTEAGKVAAMWLNGDEGSINFDVGNVLGQVIKIKSNGQMTGLTDGLIAAGSTDAITGNQAFLLQKEIEKGAKVKYFNVNSTAADSSATGGEAIAIGPVATASGYNAVAVGDGANAKGTSGIAIGSGAASEGDWTFAAGNGAAAKGLGDTVLGASAAANGGGQNQWATALGSQAQAQTSKTTAVGGSAVAAHDNSVALGFGSTTDRSNSVSVGTATSKRQLTNLAQGTQGTDAVNLDQLNAVASKIGSSKYFHTNTGFADSVTTGDDSIAIGGNAVSDGKWSLAAGTNAKATGSNSVALGNSSIAERDNSVSVGNATNFRQITGVAKGTQGTDVVNVDQLKGVTAAIGGGVAVDGNGNVSNKITVGGNTYNTVAEAIADAKNGGGSNKYFHTNTALADSVNTGADSIAIGGNAVSEGLWSLAAGTNAKATGSNSVALGNSSIADRANTVSVGNTGTQRQITNVAKGTQGTDVVNVDQLKGVTAAIGGGVAVDANGNVSNKITVAGNTYNTVAEAIADAKSSGSNKYFHTNTTLADSVTTGADSIAIGGNAASNGKWSLAAGTNAKATGDNSVALGNGSLADRANSVSVGTTSSQRQITNMAKGTLGTDGVNVDQLTSAGFTLDSAGVVTNAAVTYKAGSIASGSPVVVLEKGVGDSKYFVDGDRTKGKLPKGTVISNVADGAQDTDAANLGSVYNIVSQAVEGGSRRSLVPLVAGVGSGVDTSGLTVAYKTAAYYSQVSGKGDSSGSTPPSDMARALGAGSIAVGSNAFSNANSSTVVGVQSYAAPTATDAVALGSGSVATEANTVSLGSDGKTSYTAYDAAGKAYTIQNQANTRRLVNLAAGTGNTDGVNVSQLKGVTTTIGGGAGVNTDGTVKAPDFVVGSDTVHTVGEAITNIDGRVTSVTNTVNNIVNGGGIKYFHSNSKLSDSTTTGADSIAIGGNAASDGKWSVAAGTNAKATGDNSVALGNSSIADRANSVSVGNATNFRQITGMAKGTQGTDAVNVDQLKGLTTAIGGDTTVNADGTISKAGISVDGTKYDTVAKAIDAVNAKTSNSLGVQYDDATKAKVTLNKGGSAVTVANVRNGTVGSGSAEAINGSQLYATANSVASSLGGGATVNTDGTVKAPSYTIQNQTGIADVGTALGKIDTSITNIVNGKTGLVQQAGPGLKLTVGKDTDGTEVDMSSKTGQRQVTGVAKGLIDNAALTVAQAKSAGFTFDGTGNVTNPAVTYKAGSIASGSPAVVLDKGTGDSPYFVDGDRKKGKLPKGTVLSNVANGVQDTDAANIGTVYDIVSTATDTTPTGRSMRLLTPFAAGQGSGVDPTGLTVAYKTAAYYSQVSGKGDSSGSTPPSDMARALGAGSIAVGSNAFSHGATSTVVGLQSYAAPTATDAVALGAGSVATEANTVSLGSDGKTSYTAYDALGKAYTIQNQANTRRLVNLAAGTGNTDGVNVSQLKGVVGVIGGGAEIDKDGNITQPTFDVDGKPTHTVGEALEAVEALAVTGSANGVKYDNDTHDKVTFDGASGTTLTGLKDGAVAAGSKDAVTGNQLFGTGQSVAAVIGGGAAVDKDGKVVAPAGGFEIGKGKDKYADLVSALNGLDGKIADGTANPLGVAYDDANKTKVTLNPGANKAPVTIANVAAGTKDGEAINFQQLKGTGLIDPGTGESLEAVVYDKGTSKASVSFGGANGTVLKNVAAGAVTATSKEAINGSQLYGTANSVAGIIGGGASVDKDGKVTTPAGIAVGKDTYADLTKALNGLDGKIATGSALGVAYDDDTKAKVTLNPGANKAPVTIANVAAGTKDGEAINFQQLKGTGLIDPGTGESLEAVVYDKGSKKGSVSFGGAIGTVLKNVAAGAVNATSKEAINGSQLYATSQSVADALGGNSKVDANGKVTSPAIKIDNHEYNVTEAIKAVDAKVSTGSALGVAYDDATKVSVTLGNAGKPVSLKNVADGTKDDEAINLGQLKKTGLVNPDGTILDAVVYDAGSKKAMVTFGGAHGTILDNVADGRIGTNSRQAINGGQLAAIKDALEGKITNIDNRVTKIENHGVGGGTPGYISANGVGGSPKPADAGSSPGVAMGFDSVASGEGASVIGDHAKAEGQDSVAVGNNASTTAAATNSVALGNGSIADRDNTVSVGSAGHERTVSNVARGTADTDAVNVGLLNERINAIGASSNAYTDKAINDVWTNLSEEIDHSNRQANRGIAAASALINVTPYVPGHVTVNAGVAGYRGESALGVGVSRWSDNGRVNLNAGVSAAQGDEPVYRVGIGYIF